MEENDEDSKIQGCFSAFQIFLVCLAFIFNTMLLKAVVIRRYFNPLTRGLIALIATGLTTIDFTHVFITITRLFKILQHEQEIAKNMNMIFEFLNNLLLIFLFVDSYFGNFKTLFQDNLLLRAAVFLLSLIAIMASVFFHPTYFYDGYISNLLASGTSMILSIIILAANVFLLFIKMRAYRKDTGIVDLNRRFQTSEAHENCAVMKYFSFFRCISRVAWFIYIVWIHDKTDSRMIYETGVFELVKTLDGIIFPCVYLYLHKRVRRSIAREELGRTPRWSGPQTTLDGRTELVQQTTSEDYQTLTNGIWNKGHSKYLKKQKKQEQNGPSISDTTLISESSV